MTIEQRLKTHASLLRKIQITERRLKVLSEDLASPTTTDPARTSVQGGQADDPLPSKLHQLEMLRAELESLYVLRDQEHAELWEITGSLSDAYEIFVLRSYYFWLLGREEAAHQLFGDREDFKQRTKYYLHRISRLHSSAIAKLRKKQAKD
ncbi:MAG: hypothetical protein FWC81_04115 [Coriobacteriia bacterium]|nr:hypothetical protein [Coriobacteriia bacterium]